MIIQAIYLHFTLGQFLFFRRRYMWRDVEVRFPECVEVQSKPCDERYSFKLSVTDRWKQRLDQAYSATIVIPNKTLQILQIVIALPATPATRSHEVDNVPLTRCERATMLPIHMTVMTKLTRNMLKGDRGPANQTTRVVVVVMMIDTNAMAASCFMT